LQLVRWVLVASVSSLSSLALPAQAQGQLDVVCGVTIPWCEAIASAFRRETGVTVNITLKEAGDALARIAAEHANPRQDLWYAGSGETQLRAAEIGLIEEYRSPLLPQLHEWAVRHAEQSGWRAVGVNAGVLGIGYNSKALAGKRLPEPRCWADLAKPEYRGELQLPSPIATRTGYAMLATLVQIFGEDAAFELLKGMHRNASAYPVTGPGAIRAAARGETTIGITMLHDGVSEITNGFPIHLVAPCEGTGYDVASMAIISGAPNLANAKRFYDWALTPGAQQIAAAARNFQYPSNPAVPLPAAAPDPKALNLIRFDIERFRSAAERKRLLEKWEREVHALAR
jgi:iron(III) transport system substrate-binding protein